MNEPGRPAILQLLSRPNQLRFRQDNIDLYDENDEFVTINTLVSCEYIDTSNKVMILIPLYIKNANTKDEVTFYSRTDRNSKATFDKLLVCMDPLAEEGQNIVVFLLGKGNNENFHRDCIRMRDSGELGPGGIPDGGVPAFVVQFPPVVSSFMGDSHLALMNIPDSVIPVNLENVRLPQKKVDDSSDYQHAFCLHNVKITPFNVHVIDVKCADRLCDALDQYANGKLALKCACYSLSKREGHVSGVFNLKFETTDGKSFVVSNHTSKSFTKYFMQGQELPVGLKATKFAHAQNRRTMLQFRRSVQNVLHYVNTGGTLPEGVAIAPHAAPNAQPEPISDEDRKKLSGFTVHGWVKRGTIADQASDVPLRSNEPRRRVDAAGDYVYHVTSIRPTSESFINGLGGLNALRFDVRALLTGGLRTNNAAANNRQAVRAQGNVNNAQAGVPAQDNGAGHSFGEGDGEV